MHKNEIVALGKGTAQKNISLQELKDLSIHNSENEIARFGKANDDFYAELVLLKIKIRKLSDIKKALLSKYFPSN